MEKRVPKNEEYEDDGTWIWVTMASECRMVLAYAIGERKLTMAKDIVARTAKRLASMPLFVTDGLKFYARGSPRAVWFLENVSRNWQTRKASKR